MLEEGCIVSFAICIFFEYGGHAIQEQLVLFHTHTFCKRHIAEMIGD